ncbi:MAG: AAA family ATPase, partial [Candidatus Hydrogenedentales bacterium]
MSGDLIACMGGAGFYPHPAGAGVEVIQTHISYVFLAGDYAYKVKKPVRFEFLDFSTLDKRRHYCEEELRLNRLYAPELYLDVLPIRQNAAGEFILGGSDAGATIVEYTLQMRRFAETLLDVHQRGGLTHDHASAIGRELARLHACAHTDAHVASFGGAIRMRAIAEENFRIARRFIGDTESDADAALKERFTASLFARWGDVLDARRDGGRVRECHGDLYLSNICVLRDANGESGGDALRFFDRIEFNDQFKNIDVMYDLAFLLMDLRFRGRTDLAAIVLNTYLEQSGDYRGALLRPLFELIRANIRGAMLSLKSAEPEVSADDRVNAREEARAYFQLAVGYATPPRGKLILMCGISGSGKTTVARALAPRLAAVHVRADALRKHLAGVPLDERGDASLYSDDHTARTYDELIDVGAQLAAQ